jgi:hypothetical protein
MAQKNSFLNGTERLNTLLSVRQSLRLVVLLASNTFLFYSG